MANCVFIWSPPRCVSTAFELSLRQLPGVKCYHEPFIAPYFIGPDRSNAAFAHIPVDTAKTYDSVVQEIKRSLQSEEHEAVIVKGMSAFMEGHQDILLQETFKAAKHTFIIRHPVHSALSLHRRCVQRNIEFDPEIASFESTYRIYKFVKETLGDSNPIVVDADSLLLDLDRMLELYCKATGLSYKKNMGTKWSSRFTLESIGADPMFCAGFHDTAFNSSGIVRATTLEPIPGDEELPDIVGKTAKKQMQYYETLKSVSLRL